MNTSKPDITKRQQQLLNELKKCTDELSGQELHRKLHNGENLGWIWGDGQIAASVVVDTYQALVRTSAW